MQGRRHHIDGIKALAAAIKSCITNRVNFQSRNAGDRLLPPSSLHTIEQ